MNNKTSSLKMRYSNSFNGVNQIPKSSVPIHSEESKTVIELFKTADEYNSYSILGIPTYVVDL